MIKELEIWKDIKDYEGLYQISSWGRVKSLPRNTTNGKILKQSFSSNGYLTINLCKNGKYNSSCVHILVGTHFIDNPENKPCINHLDGIKRNNYYRNLEWVTYSENMIHAVKTKLHKSNKGEMSGKNKLTKKQVLEIRAIPDWFGFSQRKIGNAYNISHTSIRYILNNKTWKHV